MGKVSKKRSAKAAKKPEKKPVPVSDDEEQEELMDTVEDASDNEVDNTPKTSSKAGSTNGVVKEDEEEEEDDEEEEEPKAKKGRPASKKASKNKATPKGKKGKGRPKKTSEPKASSSKKAAQEDSESEDADAEYEVERIVDVENHRGGKRSFLVKWKGYPANKNSWEPEENLDCPEIMAAFMKKLDADNVQRTRVSTTQNTLASQSSYQMNVKLNKIKEGRVSKHYGLTDKKDSSPSKSSSSKNYSLDISNSSSATVQPRRKLLNKNYNYRRAAAVSCGVVAFSVGAAVLQFTNTGSLCWENLQKFQPQVEQVVHSIQSKVQQLYQAAFQSS